MRPNMGIYRGKTKDGEWVEGAYLHQTDFYGDNVDRHFIIDGTTTQDYDIGYEYEVLPETVGEWTGLTDKNGKRIFEGDIVRINRSLEGISGVVRFGKYFHSKCDEYHCEHYGFHIAYEWYGYCQNTGYSLTEEWQCDFEIIGNIHDNPELVKE